MADFLDESFGQAQPAAPAEENPFGEEFTAAVPDQQQAPLDNGNGAADEAFFSTAAAADLAAEAVGPARLDADDPRRAWEERNRAALREREQAEASKKVELLSTAKAYLDKVYQARDVQLSQRKKSNREAEAVSGVAEGAVPKGNTAWERVISVCNFNSEALSKDPFKEMSRYKSVLLAAKAANISVGAQ
jgi:hypothetical protein